MSRLVRILLAAACLAFSATSMAGAPGTRALRVPDLLAVRKQLPPAPTGTSDLKFVEIFKLPVGPLGLEPTEKLLSLDGKRVRVVGYMVRQDVPVAGAFLLASVPVSMGDEDDGLADDLPVSLIYVHIANKSKSTIPYVPGLIKLTGLLGVGARDEPAFDRQSSVRLTLDAQPARALINLRAPKHLQRKYASDPVANITPAR